MIFCSCATVRGQTTVSREQFRQTTDPDERERLIEAAPPAEKEALIQIDRHLLLVAQEGSEDNLKWAREKAVARVRGFRKLEALFMDRYDLWQIYAHDIFAVLEKQAHRSEEQKAMSRKLDQKVDSFIPVLREVHPFIYRLAFSPRAAKLEKRAEKLDAQIKAKFNAGAVATAEELAALDRALDAIFAQLKELPTLPAAQVQAEFDRFPEARLRRGGRNNEYDDDNS